MILIVASVVDEAAAELAEKISSSAAVSLLTCRDLAQGRLALRHPDVLSSTFTVSGHEIPARSTRAVVNLLPAVFPDELFFYPQSEREYQAAEFHALLTFLLASLPCPVINRPTSMSLTGPYASPLGWYHLAGRLGVPVADVHFNSEQFANPFANPPRGESVEVTYLQGKILSAATGEVVDYTQALARAAGVEYLRATFTRRGEGVQLLSVSTVPNVRDQETRRALKQFFCDVEVAA